MVLNQQLVADDLHSWTWFNNVDILLTDNRLPLCPLSASPSRTRLGLYSYNRNQLGLTKGMKLVCVWTEIKQCMPFGIMYVV